MADLFEEGKAQNNSLVFTLGSGFTWAHRRPPVVFCVSLAMGENETLW